MTAPERKYERLKNRNYLLNFFLYYFNNLNFLSARYFFIANISLFRPLYRPLESAAPDGRTTPSAVYAPGPDRDI
jgi:hypothetical protein